MSFFLLEFLKQSQLKHLHKLITEWVLSHVDQATVKQLTCNQILVTSKNTIAAISVHDEPIKVIFNNHPSSVFYSFLYWTDNFY